MPRHIARTLGLTSTLAVLAAALVGLAPSAAHAADSDIVISELMYHAPDPSTVEFIELDNTGSAPVDISGWSFTAGITLATSAGTTFPTGTVIPAGARIVGTGDLAGFQAQYGFPADFSYAGTSLSNGGEEVTLINASAAVVDDVTYDDSDPWPVAADGGGPSLEVINPRADNSVASNWAASTVDFGTPKAKNTVEITPPVTITDVGTSPAQPAPNTPFTVNATIQPGATATLTYKVMFGSDVTIPMADDDASAGGAGDGTFSATVPGAGPGQLVRYHVNAQASGQNVSDPPSGDSETYDGVVVSDPSLASAKFPVLQWFMTDADYNDLLQNHRCDDVYAPAIIAWGSQVFDGAQMRIRGQSTCTDTKVKWDVELPAGHLITLGSPFGYPMDEFALNSESAPIPGLGWQMIKDAGDPPLSYEMVRTQRNGAFYSVAALLEKYDNQWRDHHGYDNWEIYKVDAGGLRTYPTAADLAASADLDKKSPDDGDYTTAWQLTQELALPDSPAKRAWIYDNFDVPQVVNFLALTVAYRQWDSGGKNFYLARDSEGSGRWQIFHWDLDGILSAGKDGKGDFVLPTTNFNKLFASLLAVPEIKTMTYRRIRTLYDTYIANNTLINQFDAWTTCCASDIALDHTAWKTPTLASSRNKVIAGVQERRTQITAHTDATEIPVSQSANPTIVINELQYDPVPDGNAEYLELYNPSATESIDLSGWVMHGVGDYVIPSGTVLLPHGYGVLVKDDNAFRAAYGSGLFVIGQYSGGLDNDADSLQLTDATGRVVDTVDYTALPPWPTAPAGTGPSLELKDPSLDNSDPASWQASSGNGTPDAQNSGTSTGPAIVLPFGSSWRYLATGGDQGTAWRASGFDDSGWPSGVGDLGFKNKNKTTIPATTGRTTYYFRTTFTLSPGSPVTALTLSLLRDDGAVVYLNGTEVARSNMPSGTIAFTTKASTSIDGAAETAPVSIALPTGALVSGTNTLAIEVHQKANGAAGDLTLDAQLSATR